MGLVEIRARSLHVGRGHPESLVSLSENGAECLKALGLIDADAPTDQLTAGSLKCIRHEEVVNEVRVQLTLMNRHLDGLSAVYHASTPPVQPRAGHGVACPGNGSPQDACGQDHELIPDGVFALTHTKIGKTLLFFLEVDMGTQPLISNRAQNRDVRSKLTRYQALLGDGGYRRYEALLGVGGPFKGFRVLFVAEGPSRLAALCRLIRDTPPSHFVWATDAARVRSRGIWAPIWTAGGNVAVPSHSILGSVAPERPPSPVELRRHPSVAEQVP
jgi:hypothetical protein